MTSGPRAVCLWEVLALRGIGRNATTGVASSARAQLIRMATGVFSPALVAGYPFLTRSIS